MPDVFGGEGKCDFCSSNFVVHHFKCKDFNSNSRNIGIEYKPGKAVELISVSAWATCPECRALINAFDLEGLVNRACGILFFRNNITDLDLQDALRQHVAYTYELFFTNKLD